MPLTPLEVFYRTARLKLPPFKVVDAAAVPEPYARLLVHKGDMTPTLELYHGDTIHLRVLEKELDGDTYSRQVVLLLDGTSRPVEYGAIRIDLSLFPTRGRKLILQGRLPLGSVLRDLKLPHRSSPKAFFQVRPDKTICESLGVPCNGKRPPLLYGRRNALSTVDGGVLAEIVEVLPPQAVDEKWSFKTHGQQK